MLHIVLREESETTILKLIQREPPLYSLQPSILAIVELLDHVFSFSLDNWRCLEFFKIVDIAFDTGQPVRAFDPSNEYPN